MRLFSLRLVSGPSNLPDNPTPLPDEGVGISSGTVMARRIVYLEPDDKKPLTYAEYCDHRRVVGLYEKRREDIRGRVGGGATGNGALKVLKAWCGVRTGRTTGPSDVAEERRRPCRAQWGQMQQLARIWSQLMESEGRLLGASDERHDTR